MIWTPSRWSVCASQLTYLNFLTLSDIRQFQGMRRKQVMQLCSSTPVLSTLPMHANWKLVHFAAVLSPCPACMQGDHTYVQKSSHVCVRACMRRGARVHEWRWRLLCMYVFMYCITIACWSDINRLWVSYFWSRWTQKYTLSLSELIQIRLQAPWGSMFKSCHVQRVLGGIQFSTQYSAIIVSAALQIVTSLCNVPIM